MRKGKDRWFKCRNKHISVKNSHLEVKTLAILFRPWLTLPFHLFPQASCWPIGPITKIPIYISLLWIHLSYESGSKSSWKKKKKNMSSFLVLFGPFSHMVFLYSSPVLVECLYMPCSVIGDGWQEYSCKWSQLLSWSSFFFSWWQKTVQWTDIRERIRFQLLLVLVSLHCLWTECLDYFSHVVVFEVYKGQATHTRTLSRLLPPNSWGD